MKKQKMKKGKRKMSKKKERARGDVLVTL